MNVNYYLIQKMEIKNENKESIFLLYKNSKKFEKFKTFEMSIEKIKLLNLQVELEEKKEYSVLHKIFLKFFPEWSNKSSSVNLLNDIYKRMLKSNPELFYTLTNNSNETLDSYFLMISKFIEDHKFFINYQIMKRISSMILNCIHYIHKNKKITLNDFLKKDNFNHLPPVFVNFFDELENIKTLSINLFDNSEKHSKISSVTLNNHGHHSSILSCVDIEPNRFSKVSDRSKTLYQRKSDLSINNDLFANTLDEDKTSEREIYNSDLVYVFFLFLSFLFPNHLEVKLNLNMETILEKYRKKGTCIDKTIKKCEQNFIILLLVTYFISKDDNVQKMSCILNESLKYEMDIFLQTHDPNYKENFVFIDNFFRNTNCYQLNLEFNSLDFHLFQKLNIILFKNLGLKSLHLILFPKSNNLNYWKKKKLRMINLKDDDEEFETEDPFKQVNGNIRKLSADSIPARTRKSNSLYTKSKNSFIDDEFYNNGSNEELNSLFDQFNENMKNLFLILESKINILRDLKLVINPCIYISEQIDYSSCLITFIYNVLKLIENVFNEITSFEIVSEMIPLNYKILGIPSDKSKRKIDLRKSKILNLTFNVKLEGYLNITKFIPECVVFLDLVSLNSDIFITFIEKLKKKYKNYKSLIDLNMSVVLSNKDIERLINYTYQFFSMDKPVALESVSFSMKYVLKSNDILNILEIIQKSRDKVRKYDLEFGGMYEEKSFACIDLKYRNKMLVLLYAINSSESYQKLYGIKKITRNLLLFLFSFKKSIVLDKYK